MRTLFLAISVAMAFIGWGKETQCEKPPQYGDASCWYCEGDNCGGADDVDVFYVLPTCVGAWSDSIGEMNYNADVYNPKHRKAWSLSCELAKEIFGKDHRLFLPYYRQVTFGAPDGVTAQVGKYRQMAVDDVWQAFAYYMKNYNRGRRYILAGFSQGACLLIDLLKRMDDATYSRLVVAYAVGGIVTGDDLLNPHVKLADDAVGTGVTVCFNTVAEGFVGANALFPKNVACINPVSWSVSDAKSVLKSWAEPEKADDRQFPYGTAIVPVNATQDVKVRIDDERKLLVVDNIDASRYALPKMADLFPMGCLHLQELFFYAPLLRTNAIVRSSVR